MLSKLRYFPLFVALISIAAACSSVTQEDREYVDLCNDKAYGFYYVSTDSVVKYANLALKQAESLSNYSDGRDEALCNLGFAKYMTMDYDTASAYLRRVIDNSSNELYRLIADVIMMKICQRRAVNNAFYDYHNDALQKMERIRPEVRNMNERQRKAWNFAVSEYHLTLYVYYFYLRQEGDANREIDFVSNNQELIQDDEQQRLMFLFLIGNAKNIDNRLTDDNTTNLLEAATLAKANNFNYILAKALTSVAEDLMKANDYRPSRINLIKELVEFPDSCDDKRLPLEICNFALRKFQDYGSLFDVGQTYNTIADYYINVNENEEALNTMMKALECVNLHHKRVAVDNDILYAYSDSDQFAVNQQIQNNEDDEGRKNNYNSIEMKWIGDSIPCLPEWMADIREHFCIVYSAMGMKRQSDYNRNIFLDIKDITRQDKKMEQLLQTLKEEQKDVNRSMILSAIMLLLLAAAMAYFTRRVRKNYLRNYYQELKSVEGEMKKWREKTDSDFSSLEEHHELAVAERISKERRLEDQKRQYINKATCLSIVYAITPFLDRAVNEVRKVSDEIVKLKQSHNPLDSESGRQSKAVIDKRLQYIAELIERINVYNDILASWIKIRQGEVALNIENFELQPLFNIMNSNLRTFKTKGINLIVRQNECVVKADRALTLFMMNTLLENARKYSFEGGTVELEALENEQYVEIAVKDEGRGMSQEDVNTILEEKVYDSSKIGDADNDEELRKNKGFGFGLLNCKGIIEKYKKTSPLFSVCKFGIESELGKGSRFFFRLPKGVLRKTFMFLLCLSSFACFSCRNEQQKLDNVHAKISAMPDDPDVKLAYFFVQDMLDANVSQQYEQALVFADSVIFHLNQFYHNNKPYGDKFIHLYDENEMNEVEWWNEDFNTDYQTIMQMRNEVAIAALALKQWNLYYYNNEIFNRLHKLSSQDVAIENRCNEIKQANNNRKTLLFIVIAALIAATLFYYFIYYKNNILPTFALRQILELNRRIFNNNDEKQLATIIRQGVNEVRRTNGVVLCLSKDTVFFSENCPQQEYLDSVIRDAYIKKENMILDEGKTRIYTLDINNGAFIGVIAFLLYSGNLNENDEQLLKKIAQYTAENIYYSSVRMEKINADIEIIEDEKRRAEREANMVHVQNLVIDNTLSTIKHETMYYPNRIRQIVDGMKQNDGWLNAEETQENVNMMQELTSYYKEVFTILADCAAKQIVKPMFKRKNIPVNDILTATEKAVERYSRKYKTDIEIHIPQCNAKTSMENFVIADLTMVNYLLDNIVEALIMQKNNGTLNVNFEKSADFIMFAFSFDNINWSEEELKQLFYPEALAYDPVNDRLNGAQWLIAKQIIREHDEHVRRGCRIFARHANADGSGIKLSFTIPALKKNN